MPSSRARSISRTRSAGRYAPPAAGGGGGGGPTGGPTLLASYITPVGTDEATPRTVTFSTPSTAGRNIYAFGHASASLTLASPWTVVQNTPSGTVATVWTLSKANNTGISSVSITQGGTAYPFALTIFEDDVATQQISNLQNTAPGASSWSNTSQTYTAGWRTVVLYGAMTYQSAPGATISGYNNGLTQFSDTGVSSVYASGHVAWYANRQWAAWSDTVSGTATLTATATNTNTTTGWIYTLAYSKG